MMGLLAVAEDLPEGDAERPHVGLAGELAGGDAFGRQPAHRKERYSGTAFEMTSSLC